LSVQFFVGGFPFFVNTEHSKNGFECHPRPIRFLSEYRLPNRVGASHLSPQKAAFRSAFGIFQGFCTPNGELLRECLLMISANIMHKFRGYREATHGADQAFYFSATRRLR
jgi:hypothetical protein